MLNVIKLFWLLLKLKQNKLECLIPVGIKQPPVWVINSCLGITTNCGMAFYRMTLGKKVLDLTLCGITNKPLNVILLIVILFLVILSSVTLWSILLLGVKLCHFSF